MKWRYTLCGSLTGVLPATAVLIAFGTVTVLTAAAKNGIAYVTGAMTAFTAAVIVYALWRHRFHRLLLADDCLFLQTTPTDGRLYHYSDIRSACQTAVHSPNGAVQHLFRFETADGKEHSFSFEGAQEEGILFALQRLPVPQERAE